MWVKLQSRKLWTAVLGAAVVALAGQLGLDEVATTKIVGLLMAYLVGQGIADHGAGKALKEAA